MSKASKEQYEIWQKDPSNWKWGLFYYNPEDDRIFPPKKNPAMGWTINFGNKRSVRTFLLIISIPISIPLIVMLIDWLSKK